MSKALARAINEEFRLLYDCEARFKLPAAPITRQLDAEVRRPLPKTFPEMPKPAQFRWPKDGVVDLQAYWRRVEWDPWPGVEN